MEKRVLFWIGIAILFILAISYFIPMTVNEDYGGVSKNVKTKLLGILIFYNPYLLAAYVLVGIILIVFGMKRIKIRLI